MMVFIERFIQLLKEEDDIYRLADYLNLKNPRYIYQWRSGIRYPKLNNLIKIANFFECSLDYLLGRSDDFYEINLTPTVRFVDQLEYVMKETGITQKQLVDNKILSRTNLYDWRHDNNSPNIETLVKIANYLNVSVDHLVGRE